jgi:hypothetical protein
MGVVEQRNPETPVADKTEDMILAPPATGPAAKLAAAASEASSRATEAAARWGTLPGGITDGGEVIVLAIKPSMWRPVFDSAAWLVTSTVLAITLTVLGTPLPGLSLTATAQIVLLVGLGRLGVAVVFRWMPTWYVLTNRRIIGIHGVRAPKISSCRLIDIRNTYLHTLGVEKLTGLGTITYVTTCEDEPPHHWRTIAKPNLVHAEIRRAIENAIDQQMPV